MRFTSGDCHIFAWALFRLTNWPMHAFVWEDEPDLHAFVRTPCGAWVGDIEGWHELETFIPRWGQGYYTEVRPFTWWDFDDDWGQGHNLSSYSAKRARLLAPLVVEQAPLVVRAQL